MYPGDEEPEDVFGSSLFSLFAELPPVVSASSPSQIFTYRDVSVMTPSTSNWQLQAHGVWRSAIYMVDHVEDLVISFYGSRERIRSLDVLELGAASGLPGLYVAKNFAPRLVTLSDYPDPAILSTIRANIEMNRGVLPAKTTVHVVGHKWGDDAPQARVQSTLDLSDNNDVQLYDIIIAADILWLREEHNNLVRTLLSHLRKSHDSLVYLVVGLHTGRYPIDHFTQLANKSGLAVRMLREANIAYSSGGTLFRDWAAEREGETSSERGVWIVELVLGLSSQQVDSKASSISHGS